MAGKICVTFSSIKLQENPFSDSQAYRQTDRQTGRQTGENYTGKGTLVWLTVDIYTVFW
jgi:hypothetical protein